MAKKNYEVLSPLRHDGEDYQPGDIVEIEEKQAKSLVGDEVLKPVPAKADGGKK